MPRRLVTSQPLSGAVPGSESPGRALAHAGELPRGVEMQAVDYVILGRVVVGRAGVCKKVRISGTSLLG
jgi:hypothetical protein